MQTAVIVVITGTGDWDRDGAAALAEPDAPEQEQHNPGDGHDEGQRGWQAESIGQLNGTGWGRPLS